MKVSKIIPIEVIGLDGEARSFGVGPVGFKAAISDPHLAQLFGLTEAGIGKSLNEIEMEKTDLPDEDRGIEVETRDVSTETTTADLMTSLISASVREIDGEDMRVSIEDVEDWDVGLVLALFRGIQKALGLNEGGRFAEQFRDEVPASRS